MHRGGSSLTHSARTPPAVHPEMPIWGVGGSPPHFLGAKSYFFCYLERHAKIQYIGKPLMWKERKKKEKEE